MKRLSGFANSLGETAWLGFWSKAERDYADHFTTHCRVIDSQSIGCNLHTSPLIRGCKEFNLLWKAFCLPRRGNRDVRTKMYRCAKMHVLNHSHTSSDGHVHSVRPAVNAHGKTHTNTCTHAYMHVHSKRLSNVMCGDRLSALLKGCSTVKLHSMLGLQHGSICACEKFKLKLTNVKMFSPTNVPALTTTFNSLIKRRRESVFKFMYVRAKERLNYWNQMIFGSRTDNQANYFNSVSLQYFMDEPTQYPEELCSYRTSRFTSNCRSVLMQEAACSVSRK